MVVAAADTVAPMVKARLAAWPHPATLIEGEAARFDAMKAATVALACSGTVTTELALAGCPMVVGYRLNAITAAIARRLIRTRYITLLNVAAGREIVPEFVQEACTGERLAAALAERLEDAQARTAQTAAQDEALRKMGRGGARSLGTGR